MAKTNVPVTQNQDGVIVDSAFEKMLKDFTRKIRKEGILEEVKRRRYYIKPSAAKRLRKNGKPKRSLQK
jgi:ribosomal protein S21